VEFLLLAAIFFTSTGILFGASGAPSPPAAIEPASVSGYIEGGATGSPLIPQLRGTNGLFAQQAGGATFTSTMSDERICKDAQNRTVSLTQ
jgi:hypothetical protein